MEKREIIEKFAVDGVIAKMGEYGSGHINRTELVQMLRNGKREQYKIGRAHV